MRTLILTPEEIEKAATLLKEGELIAFPTETVYGLGAPIFNEKAIAKIFQAKGRPADNPLIAHISDLSQVDQIAVDIPPAFDVLADAFFPGPLTVILKRHSDVPLIASGGLDTIALRMPDHQIAQNLIAAVGQPLVAPSANRSGRPSSTKAAHVLSDFSGKIAGVIDGGDTEHGIESTVVSLLGNEVILLRPGAIPPEDIEAVLGRKVVIGDHKTPGSPGMKYRHYAPNIPVRVFGNLEELSENLRPGTFVLLPKGERLDHNSVTLLNATTFYAELRHAEEKGFEEILIYMDKSVSKNLAFSNRILRAGQLK